MDFLMSGRCVLDLHPESPGLLIRQKARSIPENLSLLAKFKINGAEAVGVVDTGCNSLAACSPADAMSLGLEVEELQEPITTSLSNGTEDVSFAAEDVQVKGLGRKAKGEVLIVPSAPCLIIGMPFLAGATIRFLGDGFWEISFTARRPRLSRVFALLARACCLGRLAGGAVRLAGPVYSRQH